MLTALAAIAAAATQGAAPAATLGDIRMHLFYQETGRLSPDISPPNEFTGWNTIIAGGSAEESAHDLLVVVEVRAQGEQNIERPLTVTARAGRRVLAQRRFGAMLTSEAGRTYLPVWIKDAGCAGLVRIEVSFGRERKTESLNLPCGE
jgi:hypothetical protein